jgi:hypothetical protein
MIIICKDNKSNRYLEKYMIDFISNNRTSNSNINRIIGIDFEFNRIKDKRQVALCQINFENNNNSDVFLFYPPNIDKNIFRKLLTADNIIKILHGSESLDLPYLYSNILNETDIENFCKNLFDTRYMCEYYNSINNIDGKCKIYDLLLSLKVITKNKYDELMKNDKLIGNIWEVMIDVRNLSKEVAKYSAYDVIYLPDLYRTFMTFEKDKRIGVYKKIIPDISSVSFTLRYNNKLNEISEILSKYNLDKIEFYNNQMTFNDIYILIFEWIKINDNIINHLYNINYFKKIIELFIKNIIYNKLNNKIKLLDFNIKNDYLKLSINNIINNII